MTKEEYNIIKNNNKTPYVININNGEGTSESILIMANNIILLTEQILNIDEVIIDFNNDIISIEELNNTNAMFVISDFNNKYENNKEN